MQLPFRTRKSNGIPVSADVHRIIGEGNAARDAGRWHDAQTAYGRAVKRAPGLAHIWVQLGHAENRLGARDRAEAAYHRALTIRPEDADPLLHLGHIRKDSGDDEGAARYYLQAAYRDPGQVEAIYELQRLLARILPTKRSDLRALLSLDLDAVTVVSRDVFLDLTAVVAAILHGRSLSAVEREDSERLLAILDQRVPIQPCAHVEGRPDWVALSLDAARRAIDLGLDASLDAATRARKSASQELAMIFAPSIVLPAGARLITAGSHDDPSSHSYFLDQAAEGGTALVLMTSAEGPAETLAKAARAGAVPAGVPSKPLRPSLRDGGAFGLGVDHKGLDFRSGLGWLGPQIWGPWTHGRGAELTLPIEPGEDDIRFSILLRGLPSHGMQFKIVTPDGKPFVGRLQAGVERWAAMELPRPADGLLRLFIKGDEAAAVRQQSGDREMQASVGVVGFHLCGTGDHAARMSLLEGIALGDVRWT